MELCTRRSKTPSATVRSSMAWYHEESGSCEATTKEEIPTRSSMISSNSLAAFTVMGASPQSSMITTSIRLSLVAKDL